MLQVDKWTSISYIHKELNLLPLDKRRDLHRAQDCFKHVNDSTSSLAYMFIPWVTGRPTRRGQSKIMNIPDLRTGSGCKAYSFKGPVFWNGLPKDAHIIENKNEFKTKLNKLLMLDENHPG